MKLKKLLLISSAIAISGFGITTSVIAATHPELITLVSKIAEYGLKGLEKYFAFLLDLFREAIKAL